MISKRFTCYFIDLFQTFLIFSFSICHADVSPLKIKALYSSLDKTSISQHLAFYHLYPDTVEGVLALNNSIELLSGVKSNSSQPVFIPLSLQTSLQAIVGLVNKQPGEKGVNITKEQLLEIDKLASRLPNRKLAGYKVLTEKQIIALPAEQIDLSRAVLLSQLGQTSEALLQIESYEASIDLMALQILARIDINDTPRNKIRAINKYIFEEMRFRFPPHSTYAKDVDLYTFLPSVLDSRKGVCLGVSILYLCLAQRLNLPLEIVTPPGHIYVRFKKGKDEINIETTARGTNILSDEYLGIDTRSLQLRNIKEVIGLAHINQASVFWERQELDQALSSYQKAKPYLPNDKQLISFIGIIHLLKNEEAEAKPYLLQVVDDLPEFAVSKDTLAADYFNNLVGVDGIKPVFMRVDETRGSLLKKKDALEVSVEKYPSFREGLFSLAGTWLQLHRSNEALEVLKRYHEIDSNSAPVEYYLAALYAERFDYNLAWKHLKNAERLVAERNHQPKALLELRRELKTLCPE